MKKLSILLITIFFIELLFPQFSISKSNIYLNNRSFHNKILFEKTITEIKNNTILSECNNEVFTDQFGMFDDGSGEDNYSENFFCEWLIQIEEGNQIYLGFSKFNIEQDYDLVKIYDGKDASATLLATYSGNNIPNEIISSSNTLYITFESDFINNYQGWEAYYFVLGRPIFYEYSFSEQTAPAIIDSLNHTIDVEVLSDTDLSNLVATFEITEGATISANSILQTSGVSALNFTNSVIYTLTTQDGSKTQDWTMNVFHRVLESEYQALLTFYNSTNGASWNVPWDLSQSLISWYGVEITNERVTGIQLVSNNLIGNIPSEIENLTQLNSLVLASNQLSGTLPSDLWNLPNLNYLILEDNLLTGVLPSNLENMTSLEYLSLSTNQLTGNIPSELGDLTLLKDLYLSNNQLSGSIPLELANLSNLNNLSLSSNNLTGNIPKELGGLSNLNYLSVTENQLEGNIPPELGNLTNIISLALGYNNLTGSIPKELGNLSNLRSLYLLYNQLTGTVPVEFNNLSNIFSFYLDNNQLSEIPKITTDVKILRINNNKIGFSDIIDNVGSYNYEYDPQVVEDTVREEVTLGSTFEMSTLETTTGTSYKWYFNDAEISGANLANYSIVFDENSIGVYTCIMTNSNINNLTIYRAPYILNQKNNVTSIEDSNISNKIKVFPNPISDVLNVKIPESCSKHTMKIFDINGKSVSHIYKLDSNKTEFALNVSKLKSGIYFIHFESKGVFGIKRFVKY